MTAFLALLLKIIPLYLLIGAGFLAGRFYDVKKESISTLAIYIVAPAVVFLGAFRAEIAFNMMILPVLSLGIATVFCSIYFFLGKYFWKDSTRSLMAFTAASGNTGYFGLPVCLAILGDEALPAVVMFMLGLILFENSVGYYVFVRAKYDAAQAFKKLLYLPSLYAFAIGIFLNFIDFDLPGVILETAEILKGAYAPLGMMIVGFGLAGVRLHHIDYKFILLSHFQKFLIYPLAVLFIIKLDAIFWQTFTPLIIGVLIIESVVPLPANSVAFASQFQAHPEKASVAVMISNFVAMAVIPLAVLTLLQL